jgi:uncharacterized membrane protein
MGRSKELVEHFIDTVEHDSSLDAISAPLAGQVKKLTGSPRIKDALSGTWLGHTLHPVLTDLPIGAWLSASVVDLTAGEQGHDIARRFVGLGVLTAVPTAASGSADWSDLRGAAQRVGLIHWAGNATAAVLQMSSWLARRRGHHSAGAALSIIALSITFGAAYLGGHLTLRRGVGVDAAAFSESGTD